MEVALDMHDRCLRSVLQKHYGYEASHSGLYEFDIPDVCINACLQPYTCNPTPATLHLQRTVIC